MKNLLLASLAATPWALDPRAMIKLQMVVSNWANGVQPSAEVMESIRSDKAAREMRRAQAQASNGGNIAVLPMYGVFAQRGNMADDLSGPGSMSCERFADQLREAANDPSVGQILIDIDSPGGSVYGVPELADLINKIKAQKPVVGVCNSLCASAAYFVGSQCSELYCTPGGEVGSIGVYTAHFDYSKAMEENGVGIELISAGKYKTEGNPYGPLDDEARAAIQASVDAYYSMFTKAVAKGRGVSVADVRGGMGQGRCLMAADAKDAGMIDGVASFDDVLTNMRKNSTQQTTARAEVEKPAPVAINRHSSERLALARLG